METGSLFLASGASYLQGYNSYSALSENGAQIAFSRNTGFATGDTKWNIFVNNQLQPQDQGGVDTVQTAVSYALGKGLENIQLIGGSHINATGNSMSNSLLGNSGNNILNGNGGKDTFAGGLGNDTYYVDSQSDTVIEKKAEGTDKIWSTTHCDLKGTYVEVLELIGSGNLNAIGNSLNNTLIGNSGNNIFNGKGGKDSFAGGLGNDTYYVDSQSDTVTELKGEGTDNIFSSSSYSLSGTYVEVLQLTGSGNFNATGNSLNNTLIGNSGNNIFNGKGGKDSFAGGLGNDTYYIDSQSDIVTELKDEGIDKIFSSSSYNLVDIYVEVLQLTGGGNLNATGNSFNNTLLGNSGNNIFNGNGGKDTLSGGLGNDTYFVDSQSDKVTELKGEGTDKIFSSSSVSLSGTYVEVLQLTGSANLNATGNSVNNTLIGNSGNNLLNGQGGTDVFNGGLGQDTAIYNLLNVKDARGGNGIDSWTDFVIGKVASNVHADKIDISDLLISYSGNGSALSLKAYVKLLHDGDDTVLQIDRDGSGSSYSFSTLLTLNNVNVDLVTLLGNQQLLI